MAGGERFIDSVSLKERFYDAHERRAYLRAVEIAIRIVDDPSILRRGRAFLERFVGSDFKQRPAYALWDKTLRLSPEVIARRLVEDSDAGQALRDSAPVFAALTPNEAKDLWRSPS